MRSILFAAAASISLAGLAADVSAIPVVAGLNGTLDQGQQVTLSGSGFGNKAQAAPFRWDDFQNGTPAAPGQATTENFLVDRSQPGGSVWNLQAHISRWPYYSSGRQRVPGDICALQDFPGTPPNNAGNKAIAVIDQPSDIWYISMWVYRDDWNHTANQANNLKIWTHFYSSGWDSYPIDSRWVANGWAGELMALENTCTGTWQLMFQREGMYEPSLDMWRRMETFVDMGDPGVANGYFATAYDGQLHTPSNASREFNGMLVPAGCPNGSPPGSMLIGNYWAPSSAQMRQYVSELYVDHSFARVEIGNNASFSSCTHREIQLPVAWTPTSITVTGNTGTFGPGSQVYLFVVDGNRQPSAGFPIVIGQAEDQGPPGVPGTVIITD
jgi:hypothetical protein